MKQKAFLSFILFWTVLMLFIDCGPQKSEWQGTIEEVDGVTFVKNPKQGLWYSKENTSLKITKEQQIGELDGPEELLFVDIADVKVNSKGDIYVADRRLNEIRKFNKDGEYILSVGRKGQGPGEFQDIMTLSLNSQDDLIAFDRMLGRISVFSDNGEHKKTTQKLVTDLSILPSKIFVTDVGYVFFGKLSNSLKLFHEFDRDWNISESYIDYEFIDNKEFEENMLGGFPGNCFFHNNGNILYTKFYYDNQIFIYKNKELAKIVRRESDIKRAYEVQVFHDIQKVRNMQWEKGCDFKMYGQGIAFVGKTYQSSLGLYPLSDGYIVNFLSLKKSKDLWELGVEIYDEEGKFLHYTKLGENLYYDIRCKDSSDLFYAIDRKEYHKAITFRLNYPEIGSE
jgi:hypothetical protein